MGDLVIHSQAISKRALGARHRLDPDKPEKSKSRKVEKSKSFLSTFGRFDFSTFRLLHSTILAGLTLILSGCFVETSYPLIRHEVTRLTPPPEQARASARQWLRYAHRELDELLPAGRRHRRSRLNPLRGRLDPLRGRAMLTEDLTLGNGRPINVFDHFKLRFEDMDTLLKNLDGLLHTAHLTSTHLDHDELPPWRAFADVWIPVSDDLKLAGRLGLATDDSGQVMRTDCVVLLPGLFGDNGIMRMRDLAYALRENRFHVLALELRACGRTEAHYPDVPTSWGVLETGDLLLVSEWLEQRPEVQRTGLIAFCWGANIALLTAWADCRPANHPSMTPALARYLQQVEDRPHYTAGVLAFSPVLRFEDLIDQLDRPHSLLFEPILAVFQDTLRLRQRVKGHRPINGSLRDLIRQEIENSDFDMPDAVEQGMTYLRLLPYKSKPAGDKLECIKTPVLIVLSANDPLIPAQDLADLMARTANPNVAAMILPGGGHIGFAAYCRAYYFSLILNFFDPQAGPHAVERN